MELTTTEILLIALIIAVIINILLVLLKKPRLDVKPQLKEIEDSIIRFDANLDKSDSTIREEFQRNRSESSEAFKANREELSQSLGVFGQQFEKNVNGLNEMLRIKYDEMRSQQSDFNLQAKTENKTSREEVKQSFASFEKQFNENIRDLNELIRRQFSDFAEQQHKINEQNSAQIKDIRESVEKQLVDIRTDNSKQLDEMRRTVDEKLQRTLNERLTQSFNMVGKQLQAVQEGLGEMRNIASDVGGLKKVLANVKNRGGIGEVQLQMLLEQILAPDQYEANVKPNPARAEIVEFAIKLPGRGDSGQHVWLPIDAKFPKEIYEQLQDAYDTADPDKISAAQRIFDNGIKKMARDISEKYLAPPHTTDFGIMFLPFEGIYAEVVRKASLLEELQRNHKIIVTGPTTLAAILNSLQMGFRTLAIQKRSSEVWEVLGAVKTEFGKFGDMMQKAQKNIQTGLNQLDDVMGVRTRAIERKLRDVEALDEAESPSKPSLSEDF